MIDYIQSFWNTNFMPHGHCYFWDPAILWAHAISDSIIALAYFIIPFSLVKIVRKREDFAYKWMLGLFALFILGCGATHVMDVINIWEPWYRLDSTIRVITALASIGTAIMLIKVTPQLILFPSAKKWKELNEELRAMNEQLEWKVNDRTRSFKEVAAEFRFLTDAIPQIVWRADAKGVVNFFNEKWFSYTGIKNNEEALTQWATAIHPEDRSKAVENWEKSVRTGQNVEIEFRLLNGNTQTYRWHLARATAMRDKSGRISKWFGAATDIHDNKIQQQELEKTNEELDNFVYVASHDLKTPINNLDGLMKILESRMSEETKKAAAAVRQMMSKSIEQLKVTVNDLADISRLQRLGDEEETQWVNVKDLIEEFKLNHHVMMRETGARIEEELELPRLHFSRQHLRSILDNLLSNALKYRAQGRILRIKVATYQTPSHDVLVVQDNGLGIKKEYHQKIFEMFRRFHKQAEGSGVGLYIVKRLVEKNHGYIEVDSEPEKGSTFRVFLKK
ncbi:sensor histidine kinase [Nafulsella turpanensis]|uniref:sensor histidine kinase n=1 Tax=Nafulsella turpanensis TaxID=1265690 RepID=UPI00034D9A5D|nr:PAS domain-containing sensor histidine kinase [Nafulsella turpanensis]